MASQARRGASPTTDNGTWVADVVQGALVLSPTPLRVQVPAGGSGRRRRSSTAGPRPLRRRTGPCTISYRLVAARSGARVLRSPAWLRTVRASLGVAALRADSARTVLEVAAILALVTRADSTAAPTWPALIEASGYSRATVARVLAWLREHRLLVTLENGSTPQFRPDPTRARWRRDRPAPLEVEGNRAAVYLLTEPLPGAPSELGEPAAPSEYKATGQAAAQTSEPAVRQLSATLHRLETPPHLSRRESVKNNPARASARRSTPAEPWWRASTTTEAAPGCAAGRAAPTPEGESQVAGPSNTATDTDAVRGVIPGEGPSGQPTRGQRRAALLAVAEQLRTRALDLRPLSVAAVASVIRDQVAQGWGVEDFVWAIDHTPDGAARTYTAGPSASAPSSVVDVDHVPEVAAERRRRGVVVDGGTRAARAVAYPAAWLRWRLAPWLGLAGPVAASRAAAAQRSAAAAAAAAARRAEQAAAVAQAVPPPVSLAQVRAALRARRAGQ